MTHEYENTVCISFPAFCHLLILLVSPGEINGPQRIRRVSLVLAYDTNEITGCGMGKLKYRAEPLNYTWFWVQESSSWKTR